MTEPAARLVTLAAVYAGCVLLIALAASLAVGLLTAALADWRTFQRLRRLKGKQ